MKIKITFNRASLFTVFILGLLSVQSVQADEFTQEDVDAWYQEYMGVMQQGREVFTDPGLGTNGVICGQCHPNGTNTHPETYPKFQKQMGKVAQLWEMVNWCIRNALEGEELAADDPRMVAILSYISYERRGVELSPGKH